MLPSWERLAIELEIEGFADLATRARNGEFDDYRSEHAMPKMALVDALRAEESVAASHFAVRVMEGEFDNTKAESDAWIASKEGQETLRDLMEGG